MVISRLTLPFGRAELDKAQEALREECRTLGLRPRVMTQLIFLSEEAGVNVLQHSGATWLEMEFRDKGSDVELIFRDNGEEFDTAEASKLMDAPVITEHLDGHLGLWMMNRMGVQKAYAREGEVNVLTFTAPKFELK